MFKNVIAPVQAWLMSQGRCVGCGRDLGGQVVKSGSKQRVTCSCGRIFINERNSKSQGGYEKNGKWRRALLEEV